MKLYQSPNWSLEIPEKWQSEFENDLHSFWDPEGFGALQITALQKEESCATQNDIFHMITELKEEEKKKLKCKHFGEFSGYHICERKNQEHWEKWWVINKNILLFITYNCSLNDSDFEKECIKNILQSLKKL